MHRCFLDLDGVLVDWVGGACKLHGVPNPFDDPANHGSYRLEDLLNVPKPEFFAPMGREFWAGLEPTPEFRDVLYAVEGTFGRENVCVLTSPVLTPGCAEGKLDWIRRHLPDYRRRFLIGPPKWFCAGPHAWLVDDSDENNDAFLRKGGNPVYVPRPWNRLHGLSGSVVQHVNIQLPHLTPCPPTSSSASPAASRA